MRSALVLTLLLFATAPAGAHPGRLDREGCHAVHEDWTHRDGRVDKKGERHCHRLLGEMKLDGSEQVQDKPHEHREREERCADVLNEAEPGETPPPMCRWLEYP